MTINLCDKSSSILSQRWDVTLQHITPQHKGLIPSLCMTRVQPIVHTVIKNKKSTRGRIWIIMFVLCQKNLFLETLSWEKSLASSTTTDHYRLETRQTTKVTTGMLHRAVIVTTIRDTSQITKQWGPESITSDRTETISEVSTNQCHRQSIEILSMVDCKVTTGSRCILIWLGMSSWMNRTQGILASSGFVKAIA